MKNILLSKTECKVPSEDNIYELYTTGDRYSKTKYFTLYGKNDGQVLHFISIIMVVKRSLSIAIIGYVALSSICVGYIYNAFSIALVDFRFLKEKFHAKHLI